MGWQDKVVIVCGSDKNVGSAIASEFKSVGAKVYSLADRSLDALKGKIEAVGNAEGHIDCLFCDVYFEDPGYTALELTDEIINDALDKTVRFAYKSALFAVPYLKKSNDAAVCFITNNSVRHQKINNVLTALCSTSIESMTKNFSSEVASSGIRMTSVEIGDDSCAHEAAGCAAFLASPSASYITGTMIEVGREVNEG